MRNDTYNGWTNRETWLVNIWFNPETKADIQSAREMLEEQYDSMSEGALKDMLCLDAVNWQELEDAMEEEEEQEEETTEENEE